MKNIYVSISINIIGEMFYMKDFKSCKLRMRKFLELVMIYSMYIVGRILWVFDNWDENCIILIYK